jgi:hypothetical protein
MSSRTALRPTPVISAQSMAANITSTPTILQSLTVVNYAVSWTGTSPVGELSVEASNDYVEGATGGLSGGTWNVVPLTLNGSTVTEIPITGNSGNGMIDIPGLGAAAVRLVYTATSGTGSLTATIAGKVM